jgi:exodeoxyribonuclease VII small subunit
MVKQTCWWKMSEQNFDFEKAFARLEAILEQMGSAKTPLDQSLSLYEEANQLVIGCHQKLTTAEQRIEMLVKNREGQLTLGADQQPQFQEATSL